MSEKIVTRFAPSPTGYMHIGGARTALFAWFFARQKHGTFILRIEDTDKEREVEGSITHIIESLKWLGIEWDEGPDIGGPNTPYLQSQRLDSYKKYANILLEKGLAYTDPYTEEELTAFRSKADEDKKPFLYRNNRPENPPLWDGTKPLRLKIKDIKVSKWHDEVRGNLEAGPEALDDFVLIKSDGYPTYNFAHIIDDLEMGVTHIFRADEFISSTPKFLALYEALEIKAPKLVTLPPIMGPDGKKKLGKRDGAKDLLDYKKEGILPEAMLNFLAFIGWNPGGEKELYSKEELFNTFNIGNIQKSGGKFNEEKLLWYNKEYISKLPEEVFLKELSLLLPEKDKKILLALAPLIKERIYKLSEIKVMVEAGEFDFFFNTPTLEINKLICPEHLRKGASIELFHIKTHLEKITLLLDEVTDWTNESIKNAVWDYASKEGRGIVLWALRYTLSGKEKSPDPFTIAALIGKTETLKRLTYASHII